MNFRERGITVGDLLILVIIIFTSTIVIKSYNNDNKTTHNHINQGKYLIMKGF